MQRKGGVKLRRIRHNLINFFICKYIQLYKGLINLKGSNISLRLKTHLDADI